MLGFQDRIGGEEVGVQRVQRVRRDLLPAPLGSLATGSATEELHVRSVREEPEPGTEEPEPEEETVEEKRIRYEFCTLEEVSDEDLWMDIHGCTDSSEDDEEDVQFDADRQGREELRLRLPRVDLGGGQMAVRLPGPVPPDPFEEMSESERRAFTQAENCFLGIGNGSSEEGAFSPGQLDDSDVQVATSPVRRLEEPVGEMDSPRNYMVKASKKLLTLLKAEQEKSPNVERQGKIEGYLRRLEVLRFAWNSFNEGRASPRAVQDFVNNTVTFDLDEVTMGMVTDEEARAEIAYQGLWDDNVPESTRSRSARGSSSRNQAEESQQTE